MKTNTSFTALIGAAALVIGSVAVAQSAGAPPPTSTAGNGCTATKNAMRGGNLGGHAAPDECNGKAAPVAATRTTTTTTEAAAATTTATPAPVVASNTSEPVRKAPMRVARADRN